MLPCIPLFFILLAFAGPVPSVARAHRQLDNSQPPVVPRANNFNVNPNGSTFLWLPQDEYSGKTFFECGFLSEYNQAVG